MTKQLNNRIYSNWDELYRLADVLQLPWVSKSIHPVLKQEIDRLEIKNGYALDIGCGLGQVSRYLADKGFHTTAIDISDRVIELALHSNGNRHIDYKVADSITFSSKRKFNLIIDFLHVHDIPAEYFEDYLQNIKSLLGEGGILIIATFLNQNPLEGRFYQRKSHFVDQIITYYSEFDIIQAMGTDFSKINSKEFLAGRRNERYESYILTLKRT